MVPTVRWTLSERRSFGDGVPDIGVLHQLRVRLEYEGDRECPRATIGAWVVNGRSPEVQLDVRVTDALGTFIPDLTAATDRAGLGRSIVRSSGTICVISRPRSR